MKTSLRGVIAFVLLLGAVRAIAQQQPSPSKTIPDSINYMWKMVEGDFTSLAEAMPEEKWSFEAYARRVHRGTYFRRAGEARRLCERSIGEEVARGDTARSLRHWRAKPGKDES